MPLDQPSAPPEPGPSGAYLLSSSREYAIYVCKTRAIPHAGDGLKDGQRIALWLLRNRAEKLKTFALSGLMGFERLYVHGETSANDTISRLAAPYCNNVPLITGLGAFGSRVAPVDGIGAPRYTDVKRSRAAEALLYADLDLVPLVSNYDGSNEQPKFFLPLIPLALLNGVSGLAVGWSTEILPRRLADLITATQQAVRGEEITPLVPHWERYDCAVTATGKPNQWAITGRVDITDESTLVIRSLPPGLGVEAVRRTLNEQIGNQIMGFTDRSTDAIDIQVRFPRGALAGWDAAKAIAALKLRERVTERIVVMDWQARAITQYPSAEVLVRDFAAWRLGWYTLRYERRIASARHERRYWAALQALFADGFAERLGTFETRATLEAAIRAILTVRCPAERLTAAEIDRIAALPTYRWTQEYAAEVTAKIVSLDDAIAEDTAILACPDRLRAVYLAELDALKGKTF